MSGILKTMKKNVEQRKLKYEQEMYTTPFGSIVICALMFTPEDKKPSQVQINKTWRKLKRKFLQGKDSFIRLTDKDFIQKNLQLFGLEVPEVFPVAMVQSNFNVLFAPYVDGHILPLREDGFMAKTLECGKVYPIDFKSKEIKKDAAI